MSSIAFTGNLHANRRLASVYRPCGVPRRRVVVDLGYFRDKLPDVTCNEARPALDPHAASSCVPVWVEKTWAVEPPPRSEPANDPVTLAVPPAAGRVNPSWPELFITGL
jgi:hypothetical protein